MSGRAHRSLILLAFVLLACCIGWSSATQWRMYTVESDASVFIVSGRHVPPSPATTTIAAASSSSTLTDIDISVTGEDQPSSNEDRVGTHISRQIPARTGIQQQQAIRFDWSGVSVATTVMNATRIVLSVALDGADNSSQAHFEVLVRDAATPLSNQSILYQARVIVYSANASTIECVTLPVDDLPLLNPAQVYSVEINKRTEASGGIVYFCGMGVADDTMATDSHENENVDHISNKKKHGKNVEIKTDERMAMTGNKFANPSMHRPSHHPAAAVAGRRIEWLGASLTCGFGDEGTAPCDFSWYTENNYLSHGPITSRALKAEYHIEAWSGKGVIRNYGDTGFSVCPFPCYFNRTLANSNLLWDYGAWVPQAVVINLGTNDYWTTPYPTDDQFIDGLIGFVKQIQTAYAPYTTDIVFFLACGPMLTGHPCDNVKAAAEKSATYYIDIHPALNSTDWGCDGHPNLDGQAKMTQITIPFIGSVMGWL
ncbi:endoglucanase E [Capsaspora owczarzaki ATCC 30864]|uniref:Endoglucanase E n=2 Tax=Capsaspora owczarzaki (strain ATCC 30864) TaxID=595528 RepID=A0A0D2X3Z1_CAPO3|nr:endoglucanase E [Capsaspora owczarzaki ATCC 30864]